MSVAFMTFPSPYRSLSLLGVAFVLVLAGCGGGGGEAPSEEAPTGGAATEVTATETEYSISLSQTTLGPGAYTFVAVNEGGVAHALAIRGPGVDEATATFGPGSSDKLTVTLQEGTYEFYCPVDGHKGLGMDLTVQVASTGGSVTTPTTTGAGTKKTGGYGY